MNVTQNKIEEEVLIELLMAGQANARGTVDQLRRHFAGKGGYGAFAPISRESCGACRVTIDKSHQQRAMNGAFITCSNCGRFLYQPDRIETEHSPAPSVHLTGTDLCPA